LKRNKKIMENKLYNSELKILNVLWNKGDTPAKEINKILNNEVGWKKSTTYTVIKRCIDKGLIENKGGDFICHALISRDEAQNNETAQLIENFYNGSADRLIVAMLDNKYLDDEALENLRKIINSKNEE